MSSQDEQEIREAMADWARRCVNGETQSLGVHLSEDMVFMTPGRPAFGKSEFLAQERSKGLSLDVEVLEIEVSTPMAFTRTQLNVSIETNPGSPPMKLAGETLTVWRRQGERWVMARDASLLVAES